MRRVGGEIKTRYLSRQSRKTKNLSLAFVRVSFSEVERQNRRLDAMIDAALRSGVLLDDLYEMSLGLDESSFRQLIGRLSTSPMYMNSSVIPYRSRRARAPSRPIR